jgi:8-oxo-dGTP pyrophosphatase MutT (NUDIX family)
MSFLDHIHSCNSYDLRSFLPFYIEGQRVGYVRPEILEVLLRSTGFIRTADGIIIDTKYGTFEDRSFLFDEAAERLVKAGLANMAGDELYALKNSWEQPTLAAFNRGIAGALGVRSYGVHVNGYKKQINGDLALWTGVRAIEKAVAPGKLDNMVAGGQPIGLSLMENLIKEAFEEANVHKSLARSAKPVSCISYVMEDVSGLKPDVMFCYDLELPDDFVPTNTDGEVSEFILLSADEALRRVDETDDYKFNVNLVVTDFAVRHGLLDPDSTPDYEAIVVGLRGSSNEKSSLLV